MAILPISNHCSANMNLEMKLPSYANLIYVSNLTAAVDCNVIKCCRTMVQWLGIYFASPHIFKITEGMKFLSG